MSFTDDFFFSPVEDMRRLGWGMTAALKEQEFAQSQLLVPRASGGLADSGYVTDPVFEGDGLTVTVEIGYGRESDYTGIVAIVQHERNDLAHPNGGQSKFLEQPVLEGRPTFWARAREKAGTIP